MASVYEFSKEEIAAIEKVRRKNKNKRAENGEIVEVKEIKAAYQAAVDHPISASQIYFVLKRHGWRKVMPRSKHPRKASEEEIAASKKLRPE